MLPYKKLHHSNKGKIDNRQMTPEKVQPNPVILKDWGLIGIGNAGEVMFAYKNNCLCSLDWQQITDCYYYMETR